MNEYSLAKVQLVKIEIKGLKTAKNDYYSPLVTKYQS